MNISVIVFSHTLLQNIRHKFLTAIIPFFTNSVLRGIICHTAYRTFSRVWFDHLEATLVPFKIGPL